MKSLVKRLKFYGIGFGFGTLFVIFFFQNRGCSWLPSNRVKNTILDRVLVVNESTEAEMLRLDLTSEDVVEVLNDGDILFNKSNKDQDHKCYIIEKDGVNYAFTLPSESFISEIFIDVKEESKLTSSAGTGRMIHFPMDDNLVYVDTNKLTICQQNSLGFEKPKEIQLCLVNSGRVNFEKSDLSVRPKAEHYIEFDVDNVQVGANFIWYKDKLNLTSFDFKGSEECLSSETEE